MTAKHEAETTRVMFRVYRKEGDVIAILLDVPANRGRVTCYQHVGQHGEGSYSGIITDTRPATLEEAAPLRAELTQIGYRLITRKRRNLQRHPDANHRSA